MRNAGLEETQAGINIAGRNINNLRYADDTTLMAESEEELKSLLMKVKAAAAAKSLQSCPTLCDPIDGSPPGSPVPGILQARTLEWVAISFSNAQKWKVKVKLLSCVWLLVTPWTAAHQAPPSMDFPAKSTGVGCHCLLQKVKEESEKVGLKLNIQKTKIMASGPIVSWQIDGETVETVADFIFLGS